MQLQRLQNYRQVNNFFSGHVRQSVKSILSSNKVLIGKASWATLVSTLTVIILHTCAHFGSTSKILKSNRVKNAKNSKPSFLPEFKNPIYNQNTFKIF